MHKKNGALLLRDHLFRSPTLDCGKAIPAFAEYPRGSDEDIVREAAYVTNVKKKGRARLLL